VNPDDLIDRLAMIVENVCRPMYDRNGLQEPISREQWLVFKDAVDLLCAAYTPREVANERANS
jgi:hypothetical protein